MGGCLVRALVRVWRFHNYFFCKVLADEVAHAVVYNDDDGF